MRRRRKDIKGGVGLKEGSNWLRKDKGMFELY